VVNVFTLLQFFKGGNDDIVRPDGKLGGANGRRKAVKEEEVV